jgi:hypothetical protein
VLNYGNDRSKLYLVDDGKQALHLIHPNRSKLDSWGNHAQNVPMKETESRVVDQVNPGSEVQPSPKYLFSKTSLLRNPSYLYTSTTQSNSFNQSLEQHSTDPRLSHTLR